MGTQTSTTNSTQEVDPWGPQSNALTMLDNQSMRAYWQAKNVPQYTGDFVATATPGQQAQMANATNFTTGPSQDAISSLFNSGNQSLATGFGQLGQAGAGLNTFATTNPTQQNIANAQQYSNPSLVAQQTNAAMTDANNNYLENVVPGLNTTAAATGNALSTRAGIAQGIAARGLNEQAANTAANLTANDWNQGLNLSNAGQQQQLSALSSLGSLGSGAISSGMYGLGTGVNGNATNMNTLTQGINNSIGYNQATDQNALDKYNYQVTQPYMALNELNNIVNTRSQGSLTTGTSETDTDPSMMSMLGSGLGAAGGLSCDERIKENIRVVGELYNGLKVYSFNYTHDPAVTHIGPMAQDVQKLNPNAVFEHCGVLHIRGDFLDILRKGG